MQFLAGFKRVTHVIGAGVIAVGVWASTDQGKQILGAIISAYPKTSAAVGVISALALLAHTPKN